MNIKNGYAATVLYRYISSPVREKEISSFEEELCELKAVGYSVEGITLAAGYLLAVLTKKLDTSHEAEAKPE